jgi:hypothetical protein
MRQVYLLLWILSRRITHATTIGARTKSPVWAMGYFTPRALPRRKARYTMPRNGFSLPRARRFDMPDTMLPRQDIEQQRGEQHQRRNGQVAALDAPDVQQRAANWKDRHVKQGPNPRFQRHYRCPHSVWHELLQPHVHKVAEERLAHGDGNQEAGAEPEPAGPRTGREVCLQWRRAICPQHAGDKTARGLACAPPSPQTLPRGIRRAERFKYHNDYTSRSELEERRVRTYVGILFTVMDVGTIGSNTATSSRLQRSSEISKRLWMTGAARSDTCLLITGQGRGNC